MIIGNKSNFNIPQLKIALSQGLSHIEFHTECSDFDGSVDFKEIKQILDEYNVQCYCVHAPITDIQKNPTTIAVGTVHSSLRKDNLNLYKKVIEAAQILCENKNPIIVIHIGTGYSFLDNNYNNLSRHEVDNLINEAKEDLTSINNFLIENYPNTTIVVENMMYYCASKRSGAFSWYFGSKPQELPNFIQELNLSNIKTCLDICHAQSCINFEKFYNPYSETSIRDYLKAFAPTLGLIHLNNSCILSEKTSNHSQPFKPDCKADIEYLKNFFDIYTQLAIDCPITLEINEDDYYTRNNVKLTIESIKKVLHRNTL